MSRQIPCYWCGYPVDPEVCIKINDFKETEDSMPMPAYFHWECVYECSQALKQANLEEDEGEEGRKLMKVHFTQYIRPNGRQVPVSIDMPEDIARKAEKIWKAGYRLEIEHLTTNDVSMTVGDDNGDYVFEVVPNTEAVVDAVARLVNRGYMELCSKEE